MRKVNKTIGVVLSKRERGENDLLFSLYTCDFGKIEVLGIGTRKIRSKLAGHLANSGFVEIEFVDGRIGNKLIHAYFVEKIDLANASGIYYYQAILKLMADFTEGKSERHLWDLLYLALRTIPIAPEKQQKFLFNIFILKLLRILGYQIDADRCAECGRMLAGAAYYNAIKGGLICQQCVTGKNFEILIAAGRQFIADLHSNKSRLVNAEAENKNISHFLKNYLQYLSGREAKIKI